jgi:hypothetical protein
MLISIALCVAIVGGGLLVSYIKSLHEYNKADSLARAAAGSVLVRPTTHKRLQDAPTCAAANGSIPSDFSMTMSTTNDSFSQSCYYAPANQSFTIDFTNPVFTLTNDSPTSLTLVISPSQNPAFEPVPGLPGVSGGSTASAVFVGDPVTAPDTSTLSVPALAPGTYDLQLMEMPSQIATLVVQ